MVQCTQDREMNVQGIKCNEMMKLIVKFVSKKANGSESRSI